MTNEEFQLAMQKLCNGDKDGLREIYEAYVKLIYSVVYNTIHNKEDAEDITSEFFVKLVRIAPSYKMGYPHKTWLVTIAKNMTIDCIRKKSHEFAASVSTSEEDDRSIIDEASDTGTSLEDSVVLGHDMKKAMELLSEKEREIIDLKLIGQFKFKEIAELLNQPIGTVSWIYNQGIIKMRRYLSDYEK